MILGVSAKLIIFCLMLIIPVAFVGKNCCSSPSLTLALLTPQTYKEWILCRVNPYQPLNLIPQSSLNTEVSSSLLEG